MKEKDRISRLIDNAHKAKDTATSAWAKNYWNNVIADSLDRIGRGADRAKEAIRDFFSIDLLGDIGNLVSGGDPASEAQGGV